MRHEWLRKLILAAIFIALIIMLAFTPMLGYIKIGPLSITTVIIPVVIGAVVLGPAYGALLGFIFGLTSFLQCFMGDAFGAALVGISPFRTFITCIVPRVLVGIVPGLLFRLIMNIEQPDAGMFEVGETVKLSYVDQQHKDIDPDKTVYQVVSGGNETIRMGGKDVNVRAYLSRFNFSGADQEKKCGVLSGGERNRLHLAIALKQEGNVLLLDEPTNDIDVNTLRALEEGLEAFAGCAVVISHDRWFLDRICTHILSFEGEGNVFYFEGNYSEYEANKAQRLGLDEPKRARYRKLMEE